MVHNARRISYGPRSPPVPRNFQIALREDISAVLSGGTGVIDTDYYGLLETLGRSPGYLAQFFSLYKFFRVKGVTVELTCVNTSSNPVRIALGSLPFSGVSTASMTTLIEQPGTLSKLLSSTGGMDRVVFRKFFDCLRLVGSYGGDRYWVNSTQAGSTSPIDSRAPVLVIGAAPIVSVNWNTSYLMRLTYHLEFFDLHSNEPNP